MRKVCVLSPADVPVHSVYWRSFEVPRRVGGQPAEGVKAAEIDAALDAVHEMLARRRAQRPVDDLQEEFDAIVARGAFRVANRLFDYSCPMYAGLADVLERFAEKSAACAVLPDLFKKRVNVGVITKKKWVSHGVFVKSTDGSAGNEKHRNYRIALREAEGYSALLSFLCFDKYASFSIPMMVLLDRDNTRQVYMSQLPIGPQTHKWGVSDGKIASFAWDDDVAQEADTIGKYFRLAQNVTASGIQYRTPFDMEGHCVAGKLYFLDIARLFPSRCWLEKDNFCATLMRPELLWRMPKEISNNTSMKEGKMFTQDSYETYKALLPSLMDQFMAAMAEYIEHVPEEELCEVFIPVLHSYGLSTVTLGKLYATSTCEFIRERALVEIVARSFVHYHRFIGENDVFTIRDTLSAIFNRTIPELEDQINVIANMLFPMEAGVLPSPLSPVNYVLEMGKLGPRRHDRFMRIVEQKLHVKIAYSSGCVSVLPARPKPRMPFMYHFCKYRSLMGLCSRHRIAPSEELREHLYAAFAREPLNPACIVDMIAYYFMMMSSVPEEQSAPYSARIEFYLVHFRNHQSAANFSKFVPAQEKMTFYAQLFCCCAKDEFPSWMYTNFPAGDTTQGSVHSLHNAGVACLVGGNYAGALSYFRMAVDKATNAHHISQHTLEVLENSLQALKDSL